MKTQHIMAAMVAGAMMIGAHTAQAQRCPHNGPMDPKAKEAFVELHQLMGSFAKAEVLPQMRTWKAQLDAAMSSEDLQTLNGLRSRATALKIRTEEMMKTMKQAVRKDDTAAIRGYHEQMRSLFDQRKALMQELKPLAEKYKPVLKTIGDAAKPQLEAWKTKAEQMFQQWREKHQSDLGEMPMMHDGGHFPHPGGMFNPGMMKRAIVARFMLWDGGELDQESSPLENPGIGADLN